MSEKSFKLLLIVAIAFFVVVFSIMVIPPLIEKPDVIGAFAAGFVNPYAAGYSTDIFVSWFVLLVWVGFEAKTYSVKHGWMCLLLGVVPGVAVGFAAYLLVRGNQLHVSRRER